LGLVARSAFVAEIPFIAFIAFADYLAAAVIAATPDTGAVIAGQGSVVHALAFKTGGIGPVSGIPDIRGIKIAVSIRDNGIIIAAAAAARNQQDTQQTAKQ